MYSKIFLFVEEELALEIFYFSKLERVAEDLLVSHPGALLLLRRFNASMTDCRVGAILGFTSEQDSRFPFRSKSKCSLHLSRTWSFLISSWPDRGLHVLTCGLKPFHEELRSLLPSHVGAMQLLQVKQRPVFELPMLTAKQLSFVPALRVLLLKKQNIFLLCLGKFF